MQTARAQECQIVDGGVCDPSCKLYANAKIARQIADVYVKVVEKIDPHDKDAMSQGRKRFFAKVDHEDRQSGAERRLNQCDQWKMGRR